MCAFVVLGLVFPYKAKRLACGTSPKWPILCRVGHKTLTQSINQSMKRWGQWVILLVGVQTLKSIQCF